MNNRYDFADAGRMQAAQLNLIAPCLQSKIYNIQG